MKLPIACLALFPLAFACQSTPSAGASPAPEAAAPDEDLAFEVVALRHADARELAGTLSNLFHAVVLPGAERQVKVVADTRTNSLLVMAPAEHMDVVKDLVARLDVELTAD